MTRNHRRAASSLPVLLLLVACGGGGGGSAGAVADTSVELALEGPAITEADHVTVHGAAASPFGIAEITANGVTAVSADGFASFGARVPVVAGENVIKVTARDGRGRATGAPDRSVTRETPLLRRVEGVAFDPGSGDRIATITGQPSELYFVDARSGARTLVSGPSRGAGPLFGNPLSIAVSADGTSIFVDGINPSAFFQVDPDTGDRVRFFRAGTVADGIAHDPVGDRVAYAHNPGFSEGKVRVVDLANGTDAILSDGSDGQSPPLGRPTAIVWDSKEERFLVLDSLELALLSIERVDGTRKLLSDLADPRQGPTTTAPSSIAFDGSRNCVILFDFITADLIEIDLGSGNRTLLLPGDESFGPTSRFTGSLTIDEDTNRCFGSVANSVMLFDLSASKRSLLADPRLGVGPTLEASFRGITDLERGRLLLVDFAEAGLFALDLKTGDRATLPLPEIGFTAARVTDVALDPSTGDLVAIDGLQFDRVFTIDGDSLATALVSDASRGAGPDFIDPAAVAVDAVGGRFIVVDDFSRRILAVDRATGDRTVLAAAGDGLAPAITQIESIGFDVHDRRIVAIDSAQPGFVLIDAVTGERSLFAATPLPGMPDVPKGLLFVDGAARAAFVLDVDSIVRIDLGNEDRLTITSDAIGSGTKLVDGSAITGDASRGRLWALDRVHDALLQVDVESGDRLIVAR